MKVSFIGMLAILVIGVSSQAAELSCFTRYWGSDTKAELRATASSRTLIQNIRFTIDGQKVNLTNYSNHKSVVTSVSASPIYRPRSPKYQGYNAFGLGFVKDMGDVGVGLTLLLPNNMAPGQRFTGYINSRGGEGGDTSSLVCRLQ